MINPYQFWNTYNPIHTEFNNFFASTSYQNWTPELHEDIKDIINIWENIYRDQKNKNQGSTSETVTDSLALIKKTIELLNRYYSFLS